MSPLRSPSGLFVPSAVLSLLGIAVLALPEDAFGNDRRTPQRGETPRYERQDGRHSNDGRSRYQGRHGRDAPKYRHYDRFPRHIYYDRSHYYYDPPRQGIVIRF